MRAFPSCLVLALATAAHAQPVKLPPQPTLTPEAIAVLGDGRLVSYHAEEKDSAPDFQLVIVKLAKSGHTVLSSTHIGFDGKTTWLDPKTLVAVSVDYENKAYTVQYFADGVLDSRRTVKGTLVWKLPKGAEAPSITTAFRNAKNELFLRGCLGDDGSSECPKPIWIQLKGATSVPVKAPRNVLQFSESTEKDPVVKAPKEPAVKLVKVKSKETNKPIPGITCTKDGKTTTWTYESMVDSGEIFLPKKLSWVMLDPLVYSATGKHYNPVGWESTETYYFKPCEPREMDNFRWLGGGLWVQHSYDDYSIRIHAGKDPVAVFKGIDLAAAPTK